MGFLPYPADSELSPDAVAAWEEFREDADDTPSPLDRTLLASASIYRAYRGWFAARDEIVPYLGERAFALFALSISRSYGASYPTAFFEGYLREIGDDPADPQVTEAEGLLMRWGGAIGTDATAVAPELVDQVEQTFQPKLRLALTGFAGLMVATCVFTVVGQVPVEG